MVGWTRNIKLHSQVHAQQRRSLGDKPTSESTSQDRSHYNYERQDNQTHIFQKLFDHDSNPKPMHSGSHNNETYTKRDADGVDHGDSNNIKSLRDSVAFEHVTDELNASQTISLTGTYQ